MKIKFKQTFSLNGTFHDKDAVVEMKDEIAKRLIDRGVANVFVEQEPKAKKEVQTKNGGKR